jgi:type IV pilus assembly protein PilY1
MSATDAKPSARRATGSPRLRALLLGFMATLASLPAAADVEVSQRPLFLGPAVPGNLILVPSVEFPTVISVANIGNYATNGNWVGYFDSSKCYGYQFSAVESERHFFPVGPATASTCTTSAGRWSGHFLNWAATQTIDPFRSALTGGNRVRDTPTETFLQKGRMDRDNQANFPRRTIAGALVTGVTPATWANFNMRIDGLGQRMWFTGNGNVGIDRNNAVTVAANVVAYNPAVHALDASPFLTPSPVSPGPVPRLSDNVVYEVSVRVKVCDPVAGLEPNCVRYASGYKPEGLIQEYSNRVRYAMLGYLNDSNDRRDGGVLRANIKYVGPVSNDPVAGPLANAAAEWDGATGVFIRNPNPADAADTNARLGLPVNTIQDSGIINYLNKFGEVSNTRLMKSIDPVSELYYAALRYVKNQGDVAAYSNITDATLPGRYETADGFPVIRNPNWIDPIQYSCQANVLLGIGDTNTHVDKNLPGPVNMTREPARPPEVLADTTVDVVGLFERIRAIEPGLPAANAQSFSGRDNSAYIASLAYHANTQDIRLDQPGRQSAQTYWVDVLEFQNLAGRTQNQYWLATKYGGFRVPSGFNPITNAAPIPAALWNSTGENLAAGYPRPDNFFPARDAANMVISLRRAFQSIVAQVEGSGVSFATNTTRLEADARVYQASFFSGTWRGDLDAFSVNPTTGQLSATPVWSASTTLPAWASRNIWVNSAGFRRMDNWAALAAADRTALVSEPVMNFLRGNRSDEIPNGAQLRTRQSPLGTFVNSQPVFVGRPNPTFYAGKSFAGAASYPAFAASQFGRTPIVYIGSNGGLFHGFNANTGVEVFAFMPNAAIQAGVATLASPAYEHRYLVDGDAAVADVYDTTTSSWRTIVVGTMGRGGRSVFALDVTNPASVQFLWEKSSADIPQLGNVLSRPVIAQVADGDWRVFLGNGVNGDGQANLVMIGLTGAGAGVSTVVNAAAGPDNGLSGVLVWDENNDAIGDKVYGTDMLGNVWKIGSLTGAPTVLRLFTALSPSSARQPISAAPLVGRNPGDGQVWVFFGTGRYLGNVDLSDDSVQTWYGLKDDNVTISGRGDLVDVDILNEGTIGTRPVRVIEEISPAALVGESGWYIDLISPVNGQQGERIIEPNQFQGLTLLAASRTPTATNICAPGGSGYVMAINPFTGGRLSTSFFDVDGNSSIGASDMLGGVPVSGIGFASAPNNPTFLGPVMQVSLDDRSRETVVTSSGALQPRRVSWRELVNE